jgi:plastocyanin
MNTTRSIALFGVATITSLLIACGGAGGPGGSPVQPSEAGNGGSGLIASSAGLQPRMAAATSRQISMMDACSPSFNDFVAPGECSRPGGVFFLDFVAQLQRNHFAGAWHNAPSQTDAWLGDSLVAINKGGEAHTFTRVATFGGGFVDQLNQLTDPGPEAEECKTENTIVPPGGTDTETLNQVGELKFQCCIHPWMRTTVLVKSH